MVFFFLTKKTYFCTLMAHNVGKVAENLLSKGIEDWAGILPHNIFCSNKSSYMPLPRFLSGIFSGDTSGLVSFRHNLLFLFCLQKRRN